MIKNPAEVICRTCQFWDARYPENLDLGVCFKAGAFVFFPGKLLNEPLEFSKAEVALLVKDAYDQTPPTSDMALVRTVASFGCCEHMLRGSRSGRGTAPWLSGAPRKNLLTGPSGPGVAFRIV